MTHFLNATLLGLAVGTLYGATTANADSVRLLLKFTLRWLQ